KQCFLCLCCCCLFALLFSAGFINSLPSNFTKFTRQYWMSFSSLFAEHQKECFRWLPKINHQRRFPAQNAFLRNTVLAILHTSAWRNNICPMIDTSSNLHKTKTRIYIFLFRQKTAKQPQLLNNYSYIYCAYESTLVPLSSQGILIIFSSLS
uniref:Secreted protein n=1 Tax=Serinus canaria TaxID=9135 RepID=A0A8C9NI11_SERCA